MARRLATLLYITEYAKLDNHQSSRLRTQTWLSAIHLSNRNRSTPVQGLSASTQKRLACWHSATIRMQQREGIRYRWQHGDYRRNGGSGGHRTAQNATGSRDDAFLKAIADAPATMARAKELADKTAAYNKAAADAKAATEDAKIKLAVLAAKQVDIETRMHALGSRPCRSGPLRRAALDLEKGEFE